MDTLQKLWWQIRDGHPVTNPGRPVIVTFLFAPPDCLFSFWCHRTRLVWGHDERAALTELYIHTPTVAHTHTILRQRSKDWHWSHGVRSWHRGSRISVSLISDPYSTLIFHTLVRLARGQSGVRTTVFFLDAKKPNVSAKETRVPWREPNTRPSTVRVQYGVLGVGSRRLVQFS